MELPNLGQHCSHQDCNQLDFLPIKCDLCTKSFCNDHYLYMKHNCPKEYTKNVQVPVCPLCNSPVPGKPDELPDYRVSRHIDADCKSDRAVKQRKVYSNKCSQKGCKQKELIPVICDQCSLNFCLRHRHPQDHECTNVSESKPSSNRARNNPGFAAALRRQNSGSQGQTLLSSMANGFNNVMRGNRNSQPQNSYAQPSSIQGNMSEDRALQLALQASLAEQSSGSTKNTTTTPSPSSATAFNTAQEQEDFLLAKAIAESEREAQQRPNNSSQRKRKR